MIQQICRSLLDDLSLSSVEGDTGNISDRRELLSDLYQRRHAVFESVVKDLIEGAEALQRQKVEQLVLELSLVHPSSQSFTTRKLIADRLFLMTESLHYLGDGYYCWKHALRLRCLLRCHVY